MGASEPASRSGGARGLAAFAAIVLLPTFVAALYFGLVAADRYVAEASFVVRSAAKPAPAGLGIFLQITGIARSQDDAYSVNEFLTSRDAVAALAQRVPLRDIYGHAAADSLSRYPSILYGSSDEELWLYFRRMVEVVHEPGTGITRLSVFAFDPKDAQLVAAHLMTLGEELVNRMNERARRDSIRFAEREVADAQARLIEAQLATTAFRTRELLLDPSKSSTVVVELIGRLSAELSGTRAQLGELRASSPESPQIPPLERRIRALEEQVLAERGRASGEDGLADKIATFERLNLNRDFAAKALASALATLETARNEARRQALYLERVVEPHVADYALEPRRLRSIVVAAALMLIVYLVGWLVLAGIREHGVSER